ncbi:hypothetical protein PF005_g18791 [Phytophthora fragariae]|uniref:Uncharacterized protein n=2 Tax=Phytophthora fragariae TaxID=53985 RepID=A0A6A3X3M1_9STRA|nr:hypothetical protein PF003_g34378 [Phytophthora fragariae]KAE9003513.1 hypothetical protein PF011_g12865 [Phytophthora fragariae]KAE9121625.1 hypothetical protein PF006_g17851 [Phytophthora fragariae]KAE9191570.1 hypothetical protein PF005_g18791 [Phytophthora fragariae]KAE9206248.1 hypothetical protein PF002_g20071 [Phytophthora fragariae]
MMAWVARSSHDHGDCGGESTASRWPAASTRWTRTAFSRGDTSVFTTAAAGWSHEETLPHVLQHCPGTIDAIRGRHDDALKSIERALLTSSGDHHDRVGLRVNQTVPSLASPALRSDLQLYNHTKKTVVVVEKQASDDPKSSGLVRIAEHKRAKYDRIKRHLERQGWKVHLSAIVYVTAAVTLCHRNTTMLNHSLERT